MKKIVISGSSSLRDGINRWLDYFQNRGFEVLNYPKPIKGSNFLEKFPSAHKDFYKALNETDILFVANGCKNNMEGYIGTGVFAEISFVMGLKLTNNKDIRIILDKKPAPENHFYEDICLWLDNDWLEIFDEASILSKIR